MATTRPNTFQRRQPIPVLRKEPIVSEQQAPQEQEIKAVEETVVTETLVSDVPQEEVSQPVEEKVVPVVEETPVLAPTSIPEFKEIPKAVIFEYPYPHEIQIFLEEIHSVGSDADMIPFQMIATYLKLMEPGKHVSQDIGCRQQINFLKALTHVLSDETDLFRPKWTAIIRIYKHFLNKHFHPHYEARFVENVPMSPEDHRFWLALLTLLRHSAISSDMSQISRACSFERVFAKHAQYKSRIEEYYGVH